MKNNFYASLLIGIGLTFTVSPSTAKPPQTTGKKQVSGSTKSVKAGVNGAAGSKKPEKTAKKSSPETLVKQKSAQTKQQFIANTKDKHGKSNLHPADSKESKADKSKSHLADSKNSKHGKSTSHQLAETKESKHSKSKSHQLADAKGNRHRKRNSNRVVDENYQEEDDEDSAVAETDEQDEAVDNTGSTDSAAPENNSSELASNQAIDTRYGEDKKALLAAPAKSSPLFFQPLDKVGVRPLVENNTRPTPPSPRTINDLLNENKARIANNNRVQPLNNGSKASDETMDNDEQTPLPAMSREPMPLAHDNKRIHSSITRGNANNLIGDSSNHETSSRVASTHGVVESSLTTAGEKAGLSEDMVMELTEIFAWDIDFANNLQAGDQFTVVYEEAVAGKKSSNQIIAAQYINQGKTYTAIRYKDKEGIVSYYTPEGRSMRKAFLSSPLDVAKVSSPFSTHRRHPILNRIRAHKGVDYAARTGTPVKAAGDGIISFHGNQGGYGRMIVISHGEHYETAYAHLSDFRKDLQDGESVKQGEVIGYVGQSGLATGPHLHYEFRVDGEHRDPENLDSKQAMRLAHDEWEKFHAQTVPVLTQINQAKANSLFAKNQ